MNMISLEQKNNLLAKLQKRFSQNAKFHEGMHWEEVLERLHNNEEKLNSLLAMEETGGEPDVVGKDGERFVFYDCVKESPKGRRSLCYDQEALEARKVHKPVDSAMAMASKMGVEVLTELEYKTLQSLLCVDTKTSSWVQTPDNIRKLGGAIFGDWRYGSVFIYHNGAESYYASRGFRAKLLL